MADSDSPLPSGCVTPAPSEDYLPSSDDDRPSPPSPPRLVASLGKEVLLESIPADIRPSCKDKLEKIFSNYGDRSIVVEAFELEVLKLIKDVPPAVETFKRLIVLPVTLTASSSKEPKTGFMARIDSFHEKVRAGLYDDTKSYIMWLKHLREFKNGCESSEEFKNNVKEHFVKMPDLWKELDAIFASVDDEVVNQGFTSAGVQAGS